MSVWLPVALVFAALWWFAYRRWGEALDVAQRAIEGWERAEQEIAELTAGDEWKRN